MRLAAGCAAFALAAILGACASSDGPQVSVEEAARAECERLEVPADRMQACLEEREAMIREARELQRTRPRPPEPQSPY